VPQVAQGVGSGLAPKPARVVAPFGQEHQRSNFMVSVRRESRHLQTTIDKPLPEPDADGWHLVVRKNKKKRDAWSRTSLLPPRRKGKVLVDLIGLCFNCFNVQHILRHCPNPSCCLRCRVPGHLAQDCNRPRPLPVDRRQPRHAQGRLPSSVPRGRTRPTSPMRAPHRSHSSGSHQ
jgi:hypothetical protein